MEEFIRLMEQKQAIITGESGIKSGRIAVKR